MNLNDLTWVDWASLTFLALFLVLGLFRGFLWQASRFVGLVIAYVAANRLCGPGADFFVDQFSGLSDETAFYLAWFAIFIGTLIVLSLLTLLLDRVIKRLELGFYDHLGGGVLGLATAAGLIVAVLGLLYKVLPEQGFVAQARESYTGEVTRYIVDRIGLPDEISKLYRIGVRLEQDAKKDAGSNAAESGTGPKKDTSKERDG